VFVRACVRLQVEYKSEFWVQGTCEGDYINPNVMEEFNAGQGGEPGSQEFVCECARVCAVWYAEGV
jgi:hypothetical protein